MSEPIDVDEKPPSLYPSLTLLNTEQAVSLRPPGTIATNPILQPAKLILSPPIDQLIKDQNRTQTAVKRRALSPEYHRVSDTTYALTAPQSLPIQTVSAEQDGLRQAQIKVQAQVLNVQTQIQQILKDDPKLKERKDKAQVKKLQADLLEAEKAKVALEARIQYLESSFNIRGAALAFTAEQQVAAAQNETQANIQRLLTATTEEKAALAHSFELYKDQIRIIYENQARDQIDSEKQKNQLELDKAKAKYTTCESLRTELNEKYNQETYRANVNELERQRFEKLYLDIESRFQNILTENENLFKDTKELRKTIESNNEQINILLNTNSDLLETVNRLNAVPPPLQERISILETALEAANNQLKQSAEFSENQYTKLLSEANDQISQLSAQLTTSAEKSSTNNTHFQDKISRLRVELSEAHQIIQKQKEEISYLSLFSLKSDQYNNLSEPVQKTIVAFSNSILNPSAPAFELTSEMNEATAIANVFKDYLSTLQGREDKSNIPLFGGSTQDQPVRLWLSQAEKLAKTHEWTDDLKKQYFKGRLKNAALTWSAHRSETHPRESYQDWRAAFLQKFTNKADMKRLILKLDTIKMKPTHSTQHFVDKILNLYQLIYGDDYDDTPVANTLKNNYLLRVFMKGLRKNIREAMYSKLPPNYDWATATQTAIDTEDLLVDKEVDDVANINNIDRIGLDAISEQHKEIETLKNQLKDLKLPQVQQTNSKSSSVNNINYRAQGKNHNNFSHQTRKDHRNNFQQRQQTHSFQNFNRASQGYPNYRRSFQNPSSRTYYNKKESGPYNNHSRHPTPNASRSNSRDRNYTQRSNTPIDDRSRKGSYSPAPGNYQPQKKCYNCGRPGHIMRECRTPRDNSRPRYRQ